MKHTSFVFILLATLSSICPFTLAAEALPEPAIQRTSDSTLEQATWAAWDLGASSLADAGQASRNFSTQIDAFLLDPSSANLSLLQSQWRACHQQWERHRLWVTLSRAQRNIFTELRHSYYAIDAWDLQPGYLDGVQDYPYSGIVHDISIALTAESLRQQHGMTDNSEISLGFHALEFLLWGELGQRQFNDYLAVNSLTAQQQAEGLTIEDLANNRRRTLLRLAGQLLTEDLARLLKDWQNPQSTAYQSYARLTPEIRLQLVRSTTQQLLGTNLPQQLGRINDQNKNAQHNRFAGDTVHFSQAALIGLDALLSKGENPLANYLLGHEKSPAWLAQLRAQITALGELTGTDHAGNKASLDTIKAQLANLATAL